MLKKWRRRHLQKKLESIDIDINHLTEKIGPIAQRYVALGERVKREAQNDRRSFTECVNDDITYYFDLPLILSPLLRNLDWLKERRFRLEKKLKLLDFSFSTYRAVAS